ncbi:hypothetical protein [Pseudactinotalea suaedae]|uniref:hypothetical protein n=1 Tax=Pseudactinotalea suaedae TaxID=1524924 RepID=UPI0012E19520|nr:hypothetical protein [Pseudactinotalea suaedae]
MFRRLLVLASLLAAALGMSLATAPTAAAAPEDVTITAPGPDGDDTTPLITGTADPTYPVRLFVDEVEVAELSVTDEGSWQHQIAEPLARGTTVAISVRVFDESGTVTFARADSWYYVWPEAVTVTISSPADGTLVGTSVTLTGTWSRGQDLFVAVDGVLTDASLAISSDDGLSWFASLPEHGLPDGPHEFQVVGVDEVGRPIASNTVTLIVDGTDPDPPVVTSPAPGSTVRSLDFSFAGTGTAGNQIEVIFASSGFAAGETVTVREDGTWTAPVNDDPSQPGNSSLWLNLSSRTLELYVVETDAAGNSSFIEYSFVLDLSEPTTAPPAEVDPTDDATEDEGIPPVPEVTTSPAPAPAAQLAATGPYDVRLLLVGLGLVLGGLAVRRRASAVR